MGILSNGCKLGAFNKNGFEHASLCLGTNGYPHHGSGEVDEARAGSGATSMDAEELLGDNSAVVQAVQVLLDGLGEDTNRVGLIKTPLRVTRAFAFATKGYRQVAKDLVGDAIFPEAGVEVGSGLAGGMGGMVIVRSIDQFSLCGSCLLPFKVCCHIAYVASGYQVVGLSKLARVADMYARRLQNPQTLAEQICQGLSDTIQPLGVGIALQSWHLPVRGCHCSTSLSEGVFPYPTVSVAGKGQFEEKGSVNWKYFLAMLRLEGVSISDADVSLCNGVASKVWCPCAKVEIDAVEENPIFQHNNSISSYINGYTIHNNGNSTYSNANSKQGNGNLMHSNGNARKSNGENGIHGSSAVSPRLSEPGDNFLAMVAAVEVIMDVLVGGHIKENLRPAAKCYTRWLLHFRKQHQEHEHSIEENGSNDMNGHGLLRVSSRNELPAVNGKDTSHSNVVMAELDAPFFSLCEHHLLPFFGIAHVGYYASEASFEGVERSVLIETVEALGHRLQVQERLTREIAETLTRRFKLQSIIVVVEASHTCMVSRGVEKLSSTTATQAVLGRFATDDMAKLAFLEKICKSRNGGRTFF